MPGKDSVHAVDMEQSRSGGVAGNKARRTQLRNTKKHKPGATANAGMRQGHVHSLPHAAVQDAAQRRPRGRSGSRRRYPDTVRERPSRRDAPAGLSVRKARANGASAWCILAGDLSRRLNAELEQRVAERTHELEAANRKLVNEIAKQKRTEDSLREGEERYRLLVDTTERNRANEGRAQLQRDWPSAPQN